MRLYPPFVFVGREALKDLELGGFRIKKGQQLAFVGWTIHREESNWPDPERVDPNRHSREERKNRHRVSFVAFGHGKRRCLGQRVGKMESTLMLAMAAQRFRLDHLDGSMPEPMVQNSIKPKNGMQMLVRRR
jgi:cytochrome P450